MPSIEVRSTEVRLQPVEAQTFDVQVAAPRPVVQVVSEGPQGPIGPAGPAGTALVQSVNGAVGTVVLDAAAVGAVGTATGLWVYDDGTAIPSVRPDAAAVYWRGTAQPGTAIAVEGDIWFNTGSV